MELTALLIALIFVTEYWVCYWTAYPPILLDPMYKRFLVVQTIGASLRRNYPLDQTLALISKRIRIGKRKVERLRRLLQAGVGIAEAIRQVPGFLPRRLLPYVEQGDRMGRLPLMHTLMEHECLQERRLVHLSRSSLLYPFGMAMVMGVLLLTLETFVFPIFAKMFQESSKGQMGLPNLTDWWLTLGGPLFFWIIAGMVLLVLWFPRLAWHRRSLRLRGIIPDFGRGLQERSWGRFCLVLASLLREGAPMPEAITVAGEVSGRKMLRDACVRVAGRVRQGEAFSAALQSEPAFPDSLAWTVKQGERLGTMPDALMRLGERYEESGMSQARQGLRTMEIMMLVVLMAYAAFAALAFYLPIFHLAGAVS